MDASMQLTAHRVGGIATRFLSPPPIPANAIAEYMLPVDEYELDRMDMQHHKYTLLQGDKLYLSPLHDDPQKILDIGTGAISSKS